MPVHVHHTRKAWLLDTHRNADFKFTKPTPIFDILHSFKRLHILEHIPIHHSFTESLNQIFSKRYTYLRTHKLTKPVYGP